MHIFATQVSPAPAVKLDENFAELLDPISAAEIAAGITTVSSFREGDIRRHGATTVSVDNSTAINAALLASANSGVAVYIPPGTWAYTSTLNATLGCSMYGAGQSSILNPNGCDGITFTNQPTYAGSRFFKDFVISGTSTTDKAGIKGAMLYGSGTPSNRVTSILFDGLTVMNFKYGINAQGFWNCLVHKCFLYNNYQGVLLTDKNINFALVDCVVQKGAITGAGDRYGFYADQLAGVRSEDILIRGCFIYGYDYAVGIANALFTVIEHCDFDNCQLGGVFLVTANGTTTVRSTWINTVAGQAIELAALGSTNNDGVILDGNHLIRQSAGASTGVAVGNNQNNVKVLNNSIRGFNTAVSLNADYTEVHGNDDNASLDSCVILSGSVGNYIHGNKWATVANKVTSANAQRFGPNQGCTTEFAGNVVFPASATSVVITYASLGLPNGPTNGVFTAFVNSPNVATVGSTWAIATATQITLYRETALGTDAAHSVWLKSS